MRASLFFHTFLLTANLSAFMLRLGLCLRMAFDHYLFASKGVYYDRSALSSAIVYPGS